MTKIHIKKYGKMVRTKIPRIIEEDGATPTVRTYRCTSDKVSDLFKAKIEEEAAELISAKTSDKIVEEAADLAQVILDYLHTKGFSARDLETVRSAKEATRGSFLDAQSNIKYLVEVKRIEE